MFSLPAIQFRSLPCTGRWWRWSSCTPPRTTASCTSARPPSSLRSDLRTWAKWTCISNRNGSVALTWNHLGQLHTQLRASQMRPPSDDTPWRRSPGGEGELFQVNFSRGSYFVATPPKLWCFQHKGCCLTCPARGCSPALFSGVTSTENFCDLIKAQLRAITHI